MAALFSVWNGMVETAGLIAIIVLALCIMVQAVRLADVPKHLASILGIVILLTMVPAIMAGLWKSMTTVQHLSIVALGVAIVVLSSSRSRGRAHNVREK